MTSWWESASSVSMHLFWSIVFVLGQQLRQSSALHFRVQHPQWPSTTIPNPDPLSSSHLLLPTRMSDPSFHWWRWRWTGQPRDCKAGQASLGHSRGGDRRAAKWGQATPLPTAALPIWAFPGLTGGRPQSRPLWSHGDVNLWGSCGLQPGTRKHHQLCTPALEDWLAGPQRTFSKATGADGLSRRLWSSQWHRGGWQVLGTGGPRGELEEDAVWRVQSEG